MARTSRLPTLVLVALAIVAVFARDAGAAEVPALFSTVRCDACCHSLLPVYAVRPRHVYCQEAAGGALTLSWSSWTRTRAVGAGVSREEFMGQVSEGHITVVASRVRDGHFSRLQITFAGNPHPLVLHVLAGDGGPYLWG